MARKGPLWYVFVGSRGGDTRINIVESLLDEPKNPRELALEMGKDYSTITHSLRVLQKNRMVYLHEKKYGAKYHLTPEFETLLPSYEEMLLKAQATVRVRNPSTTSA